MDNILRVNISHRLNDTGKDLFDLIFFLDSLPRHFSNVLVKIIPVHVFYDDGDLVARVDGVIKSHYTPVV